MFTGIATNTARIIEINHSQGSDYLLKIELDKKVKRNLDIGCSIACNGICLTLVKKEGLILSFKASKETCDVTTLKNWLIGQSLNIEFALRAGDEFGGHMVLGHIDGVAILQNLEKIQDSWKMRFALQEGYIDLMRFIAKKGSICIDGISLTINEVDSVSFEVNIISYTFENTNLKLVKVGDNVNIEVDLLARHVLKNLPSKS
jgi:riboflavin synthase